MSQWRLLVLVGLVLLPALFLMGTGTYHLYVQGWAFFAWWPMAVSLGAAYYLAYRWQRGKKLLHIEVPPEPHWTDRDRQAWVLVEARVKAGDAIPADRFSDPKFYFDLAQELALELARFYHPKAQDPFGTLTVPEILAVAELASGDLAEMVEKYLPAGHLLTINDWKRARQATEWYRTASNVYWATSAVFNPIQTGLRYLASQYGMTAPLQKLQQNLILWFYTAYVQRLGTYLIELNSGRLRVGAKRYRELLAQHRPPPSTQPELADDTDAAAQPAGQVTLTVFGQVNAGKSSTINALLGERKAQTDVLPATDEISRYEVRPEGVGSRLTLLDTVGYGHAGPKEDQLRATEKAAQQSDLLLLVLHGRNPARQADLEMLTKLRDWFHTRPDLKMPPVLAVVTHIDLLSPAMEWVPPYDWVQAKRPKEQSIRQALAAVRDQLGEFLTGAVPVCVAEGKVFGVVEGLLPALAKQLDEAHAVALLRVLKAETNTGKVRRVFDQLRSAGQKAAEVLWQAAKK
jgi:predicted GTPase